MNNKKIDLITVIITILLFLLPVSCDKKVENENPTISFISPDSNLVISNDTLITFIVETYDKDGTIARVEFSHNGTIVQTVINSPYEFDWSITTEDNTGIHIIKAIAYDNAGEKGEAEIQIEIKSYLTNWTGDYEGDSHNWFSYPTQINGQWQFVTYHSYAKASVNVSKSSQDSCLDFMITYNDSIVETKNGLKFSVNGIHFSQWGGGSGYGSLNIRFISDSLYYNCFQKCGIPCDSGTDIVSGKK